MEKSGSQKLNYKVGLRDGLPIGLGYLSVAFAFGVQATALGVPILITVFISMTNLTSAGQLMGVTIVATLGSFVEIIVTQLVINSRYFLMSLSLSQKIEDKYSLPHRLLSSAFITDEIYAVASSKKGKFNPKYFYGLATLPYIGWVLGTVLGAVAGDILPKQLTDSLGLALYAMFIAIFTPPATKEWGVLAVILTSSALSCAFFFIPFLKVVSKGFAIIICAVVSSLIMAAIFPVKNKDEEDKKEVIRDFILGNADEVEQDASVNQVQSGDGKENTDE